MVVDHAPVPDGDSRDRGPQISMEQVLAFCFPERGALTDSCLGRVDVLAKFGPLDSEGRLRGGSFGSHQLQIGEVKQMALDIHARRWSQLLKREYVDDVVPHTLGIDVKTGRSVFGREDLRQILLRSVDRRRRSDDNPMLEFRRLQAVVLGNVDARFQAALSRIKLGRSLSPRLGRTVIGPDRIEYTPPSSVFAPSTSKKADAPEATRNDPKGPQKVAHPTLPPLLPELPLRGQLLQYADENNGRGVLLGSIMNGGPPPGSKRKETPKNARNSLSTAGSAVISGLEASTKKRQSVHFDRTLPMSTTAGSAFSRSQTPVCAC